MINDVMEFRFKLESGLEARFNARGCLVRLHRPSQVNILAVGEVCDLANWLVRIGKLQVGTSRELEEV